MKPSTNRFEDTADDAAQRPDRDAEADQVRGPAVDVWLHVERDNRLNQDVERPDPEGQHRPDQVHGEQGGLLLRTHTDSLQTRVATLMRTESHASSSTHLEVGHHAHAEGADPAEQQPGAVQSL